MTFFIKRALGTVKRGCGHMVAMLQQGRSVGFGMRKRCEIDKKLPVHCLAVCALSVGLVQAAVPAPESSVPSQRVYNQEKGDDWFAEIDDMIQDRVVPSPLMEATNPPGRVETNQTKDVTADSSRLKELEASTGYTLERPLVRKQLVQALPTSVPTPTPMPKPVETPVSSVKTIDSSIIEEILRSDYWLEDDSVKNSKKEASNVIDGRKEEKPPVEESPLADIALPTVTAEDQLLLLEKELLIDLSKPKQMAEQTNTQPSEVQQENVVATAETVVEEKSPAPESALSQENPAEAAPAMTQLEEELLAELDDFGVEKKTASANEEGESIIEQEARPAIAEEDLQADRLIEELALETPSGIPEPAVVPPKEIAPEEPEVDAVLSHAEQVAESTSETLAEDDDLFSRVELLQAKINDAVKKGNRAELASLSGQLALLLQEADQNTAEQKEPARVMASAEVRPTPGPVLPDTAQRNIPAELTPATRHASRQVNIAKTTSPQEREQMSASPEKYAKRFVKEVGDEERSSVVAASPELVDSSKTAEQKSPPRAVERTIIIMDADKQTTPLKQKDVQIVTQTVRVEQKASTVEPKSTSVKSSVVQQAALPEKSAPLVAPKLRKTTEVAAGKPSESGKPDPVVFMRTAPSDEMRPSSGGPSPAKVKNTSVVIPASPVDDWDAPVPLE